MKKLLLPFFIATFMTSLQATEICVEDSMIPSGKAEELAQENCDVVDKIKSCAEAKPDPSAMKRKITDLLERADNGEFLKNWEYFGTLSSVKQVYVPTSSDKRKLPTAALDWLSETDFSSSGIKKEDMKNSIIEKYVDFSQKFDCEPRIKYSKKSTRFPAEVMANTEEELKKKIAQPSYIADKNEFFKKLNSKSLDTLKVCNGKRNNPTEGQSIGTPIPPCTGNMTGLFEDNVSNISSLDKEVLNGTTNELSTCIQKALADRAKIHHVSIVSSSSALNNTGDAAKRFCRKGFLGLSEARAKSVKDKILPEIFSKAGQPNFDYSSKVKMSFTGSNGDGTSGACPYTIVDGKEVLKDKYKTSSGKRELDKNKYVTVHVTFEETQKAPEKEKLEFYASYACRELTFECSKNK